MTNTVDNSIGAIPYFLEYPRITVTLKYDGLTLTGPSWYTEDPRYSYELLKPQEVRKLNKREECEYNDFHFLFELNESQITRLYSYIDYKGELVEHFGSMDLKWVLLGESRPYEDYRQYILINTEDVLKVVNILPYMVIQPIEDKRGLLYQIPPGMSDDTLKSLLSSIDIRMEYIKRWKRYHQDDMWSWERL